MDQTPTTHPDVEPHDVVHRGDERSDGSVSPAPVLVRLFAEWSHLTISSEALRTVRSWHLPGAPVDSLDDLLAHCGYSVDRAKGRTSRSSASVDTAAEDEWLLHLLGIAPDVPLAARIVLQRILPALAAVARRHAGSRRQRLDLLDELVANAWPVICTYPTDRRPARVVPNLVRDITFQTLVRPTRRRRAGEVPTDAGTMGEAPAVDSPEPLEELIQLLRDVSDSRCLQPDDIGFICQLINHGRPEQLAATLDVTARTVRNRRDAVVHRVRAALATAA